MRFQEESYLYVALIAGVVLLLLGVRRMRASANVMKAFTRLSAGLSEARAFPGPVSALLFTTAAVILIVLALAGPDGERDEAKAQRKGLDLLFLVDTSQSMKAREGGSDRLEHAVRQIRGLLPALAGERVGLAAFAGDARMICPLTADLSGFSLLLDTLDRYSVASGGTNIGPSLLQAVRMLDSESDRSCAIVLATDGENLGDHQAALSAAVQANEAGVPVFTLMLGALDGAKIPDPERRGFLLAPDGSDVLSRPNPGLLRRIAQQSGGAFVAAWEIAYPLDWLYNRHLSKLAAQPMPDMESLQRRNSYQSFLFAGLVFWLLHLFLPQAKRGIRQGVLLLVTLTFLAADASAQSSVSGGIQEGIRLYRLNDYSGAQACFESALQRNQNDPDLLVNLGLTLLKQGTFDRAVSCFDRIGAMKGVPARRAALFGAGLARYRQADQWLNLALESDRSARRSMLEKAVETFERARALFETCLTLNAWPEAARHNLFCADRKLKETIGCLEADAAADQQQVDSPGDSETGVNGASEGEDDAASSGGIGEQQDAHDKPGQADPADEQTKRSMTQEEKMRIFAILDDLEKERIRIERNAVKAVRRSEGGRDW